MLTTIGIIIGVLAAAVISGIGHILLCEVTNRGTVLFLKRFTMACAIPALLALGVVGLCVDTYRRGPVSWEGIKKDLSNGWEDGCAFFMEGWEDA